MRESDLKPGIAVFASHDGTTLQSIIDAVEAGLLPARVCVVISNNSDSGALRRAKAANAPAFHLSSRFYPNATELDQVICDKLISYNAEWVVLAGYMKKLGPITLDRFRWRIRNTHPSLLPKHGGEGMYGSRVHAAVLAAGELETGASVHLVEAEYDTGPVIAQCRIPVRPSATVESLAERVQAEEKLLLVRTLGSLVREASRVRA